MAKTRRSPDPRAPRPATSHRTARARARARRPARGVQQPHSSGGTTSARPPIVRAYLDAPIADNFAGGGGASLAIELAIGRSPDVAVNHDAEAIAMHAVNHPGTRHYTESVYAVDPREACGGKRCALAWFSPDCKHHSKAKGGEPRDQKIRGLAWIAVTWAARVAPTVICLENVEEFLKWGPLHREHTDGCSGAGGRCRKACRLNKPIKSREGETFRAFVRRLQRLGYKVEWKLLRACDYGAPTTRRRLFLVARRDGKPIRWPKPTHGKPGSGLKPYRTAAECIDWTIPCPSIFGRKKPLADKTLARIARGIKRFVLESGSPFVIPVNHGGEGRKDVRIHSIDDPLPTVTGGCRGSHAVVTPFVTKFQENSIGQPVTEPLDTVMAGATRFAAVEPVLERIEALEPTIEQLRAAGAAFRAANPPPPLTFLRSLRVLWGLQAHPENSSADGIAGLMAMSRTAVLAELRKLEAAGHIESWQDRGRALGGRGIKRWRMRGGIVAGNTFAAPMILKAKTHGGGGNEAMSADEPLRTVTASKRGEFAVAVPYMVHLSNGERPTQEPRIYDINEPCRTIVAQGVKQGLCEATLAPVTSAKVAAILKHYGGNESTKGGTSPEAPLDTITTQDHHSVLTVDLAPAADVEVAVANVIRFNGGERGAERGQDVDDPLSTVDTSRRHGLIASHLVKLRGTSEAHLDSSASGMDELVPTISAQGNHLAAVHAFLVRFNGAAKDGQIVDAPIGAVTSKPRFGLVTVTIDGEEYAIVDIGMRMLEPRELFNAQGFPPDYVIDLVGPNGKRLSKTAQIRMCGNSVSPPVGAAVVAAQFEDSEDADPPRDPLSVELEAEAIDLEIADAA